MIRVTVDYDKDFAQYGVEFYFREYYEMTDFIKKAQEYSDHTYFIEFEEDKEETTESE